MSYGPPTCHLSIQGGPFILLYMQEVIPPPPPPFTITGVTTLSEDPSFPQTNQSTFECISSRKVLLPTRILPLLPEMGRLSSMSLKRSIATLTQCTGILPPGHLNKRCHFRISRPLNHNQIAERLSADCKLLHSPLVLVWRAGEWRLN